MLAQSGQGLGLFNRPCRRRQQNLVRQSIRRTADPTKGEVCAGDVRSKSPSTALRPILRKREKFSFGRQFVMVAEQKPVTERSQFGNR
jgi:hypothetical protein